MEELNSIIERLCSRSDILRRQVRQISRVLLEVSCYTYANYYTKLGEHKLAAVYTLYLTYSRDMLRDMAMTVAAMNSSLNVWIDMFLIISAAHMLHTIRETRESMHIHEEQAASRPHVQTVVNLSDYMKIVKLHKELLMKLTNSAETYDLILSAMTLSIGHLLLITYMCACQEDDEIEHIRKVIDYAMTEDSKKILSDYYSSVVCEISG